MYLAYLSHLMYLTYLTYITLVGQVVLFGLRALFGRCVVFGLGLFGIYATYFVIFIGLFNIITYSIYLARNGKTQKRRDGDTETRRNGNMRNEEMVTYMRLGLRVFCVHYIVLSLRFCGWSTPEY